MVDHPQSDLKLNSSCKFDFGLVLLAGFLHVVCSPGEIFCAQYLQLLVLLYFDC